MLQAGFIEVELDSEGTILWVNRHGIRELGFERAEQAAGSSFVRLLKSREQWTAFVRQTPAGEEPAAFIFHLKNKIIEGAFKKRETTASGVFNDITDRFVESEAIRHERNRLGNVLKTLSEGLILFDRAGTVREINQAALDLFGTTREEMVGKPYHAPPFALLNESGGRVARNDMPVYQVIKTGRPLGNIIRGIKKADGTVLWVNASVTPIMSAQDELEEIALVLTDVTRLFTLEQRNQRILETAKEGYWEIDLEGRISKVNRSLSRFLGYKEAELPGKSIYDLVDGEQGEALRRALEKRREGVSESYPVAFRSRNGREIYTMVSASPLADGSGRVTGEFAFITDLSVLRATYREIERQHSTISAINKAIVSYIRTDDISDPISHLLNVAVKVTGSEYGAVGSLGDAGEKKALQIIAMSGMKWRGSHRKKLYDKAMQRFDADGAFPCPFMDNLFGSVIQTKKAVISNHPDDPRRKGVPEGHLPLHTFLGIPFLWHDRVMGLIALANKKGGYAEHELELIETMAKSISLILYRDEERKASLQKDNVLNAIASFSRELTRALTEEEAYEIFRHYLLSLRKGSGRINALSFVAIDPARRRTIEILKHNDTGVKDLHHFPGLERCKSYIYSGTFLIKDLSKEYACPYQSAAAKTGSYCCTALNIGGSIAGILYMYSAQPGFFSEDIKETIDNFIALLTPVINTMRLLEANKKLALIDPLTGLYNRRYLETFMEKQLAIADRNNQLLSIVMFDIDNFKAFNDTHGHDAGDVALRSLAQAIAKNIRASDIGVRYGGEEFVIVLPNTDKMTALDVAERIRTAVEVMVIAISRTKRTKVTASFGIATYGMDAESLDALITKADAALYRAKRAGKNRTCLA